MITIVSTHECTTGYKSILEKLNYGILSLRFVAHKHKLQTQKYFPYNIRKYISINYAYTCKCSFLNDAIYCIALTCTC